MKSSHCFSIDEKIQIIEHGLNRQIQKTYKRFQDGEIKLNSEPLEPHNPICKTIQKIVGEKTSNEPVMLMAGHIDSFIDCLNSCIGTFNVLKKRDIPGHRNAATIALRDIKKALHAIKQLRGRIIMPELPAFKNASTGISRSGETNLTVSAVEDTLLNLLTALPRAESNLETIKECLEFFLSEETSKMRPTTLFAEHLALHWDIFFEEAPKTSHDGPFSHTYIKFLDLLGFKTAEGSKAAVKAAGRGRDILPDIL